ncbi:hypothetical protein Nepgr_001819 [Nepenthes gracilis]|uniref:DYW domain-containing protein n=1 Tax=Nepenthes gracilis TaxID=150966 RepID=A0AAD3P6U1_NEPGR|nr:hypothetical protein Nepgr_001819 [Nepenthes gracilis]
MMQCLMRHKLQNSGTPLINARSIVLDVPSAAAYVESLELCLQSRSLREGQKIHQHLLKNSSISSNSLVLEKLTRLYIECKKVEYARHVFDRIPDPSVIVWNLMIRAFAWNGPAEFAIDFYRRMLVFGIIPTKFTFPFVLKACASLDAVEDGEKIHGHAIRIGLDSDAYVSTALVDLYAKCGNLVEAQKVFRMMCFRDVVAWNAMIAGFSLHGLCDETIKLAMEMQRTGIKPNSSTVVSILPTIAQARALSLGKTFHGYCVRHNFDPDVVVGTGLLDMYGKCGCLTYARMIFDLMRVRNEVTWSAMIGAYIISDCVKEALELFDHVLLTAAGSPSPATFCCALRACSKLITMNRGRRIHCQIFKLGYLPDIMLGNTIISMYAKCGALVDAIVFFHEMNHKDVVSWGAMISGCVQNGNAQKALDFFRYMNQHSMNPDVATMLGILPACAQLAALQHGACAHGHAIVSGFVNDCSICNALIDMYSKCGMLSTARRIFDKMHKWDIVSWNSMIAGYGIHGLGSEALSLFHELRAAGLKLDDLTFISVLTACSHSGLVEEGKHWFDAMVQEYGIVPRIDHYICMVDLLGRAGNLEEAKSFIEKMPFEPNIHIWNALLAGCRIHRNVELGEEASGRIQTLGPESTGNFVLLSNIYSSAGRWQDAASVRIRQSNWGFKKRPGCSWVEINGKVHAFIGGDRSHPKSETIHKKLEELLVQMKKLGYNAVPSFVLQDVEEEEKEHILLYHSEKLAIAFAITSLGPNQPILVTKNLRVCGDCHDAIKYIALITKREITVRDTSRFHHFKDGVCNCRDFW